MNLENQVTSIELSKKLKSLGVKQESTFYWYYGYDSWLLHYIDYNHTETDREIFIKCNDGSNGVYSAFTVAELGELLPTMTGTVKDYKSENDWVAVYEICGILQGCKFRDKNEADVRAKILIHLIGNNLMEVPK